MLNILVADDLQDHLRRNVEILKKELMNKKIESQIDTVCSIEDMNKHINHITYDIILSDIDFEGKDILQLVKEINAKKPDTQVIFITSYLDYAREICETNFVYFLLKKDIEEKLPKALDKALNIIYTQEVMTIKENSTVTMLPLKDIVYFERDLRTTHIHLMNGECKNVRTKICDLENELNCGMFIICHQSYMINVLHVISFSKTKVIMDDDTEIVISRKYQKVVNTFLVEFLKKKNE